MRPEYPETQTVDQTDDLHGTLVRDPYRWLEEPASTPEVRRWIDAQNALTESYLADIPEREEIKARLTELWNYPKQGAPFAKGGRYFGFRNTGLQNQDVLFVMDTPSAIGRVLLDPDTLSDDGTVSLRMLSVSPDGRHLAYATSESGSDWQTWFVRDIETGEDLDDALPWSKFSGATWLPDGSGFLYKRYPEPQEGAAFVDKNEAPELFVHTLGTPVTNDSLEYSRPDKPEWNFYPMLSDDDRYLVLHVSLGTMNKNLLFVRELGDRGSFTELIGDFRAAYTFVGNDGSTFYLKTDDGADRGRIVAVNLDTGAWTEVVPESNDTLEQVVMLQDNLVCLYLQNASHRLRRYRTTGEHVGDIALPGLGSVETLSAERDGTELFYTFTSFLEPVQSFRFDVRTGDSERLDAPALDFDTPAYTTRQVFATSKDGTRVPLFLVHRKDVELNGQNPTLLYGYGGFNIALTPSFSVGRLVWLERGGVLAVANLRGGGEYGTAWHEAGTKERKQNVFDDFIACAEHLIAEGVTSSKKLAVQGGSNGGLLVGACMTQRPELFGACLPAVGVLDMLRFHKFTIGWAWTSDYGSADDEGEFGALYAYSPLHNLRETCYPPTLVTTGDFDDRVVPAHSFKFAAALQAAQTCDAPTIIRVQTKAGHGQGKPTKILIEEQTDVWSFLHKALSF
ncbi:MAG: Prolyl endopeptidase [uncultured Truepera sp.]|uniref:prolyl oligopeptidase n=1 Tax=uncultured Truepera sp. TaxID=543023 RepID=A0A6J4UV28_9DEIN|nr:MAG: Prolyl endopeptidase [uncultured Truepera sp.]